MKKLKITAGTGNSQFNILHDRSKIWILWEKKLFGWRYVYSSSDSKEIRELKNHLFLPDKIYTSKTNKESE